MSIGLTPAGRPRWAPLPGDDVAAPRLQRAFDTDWREALFTIAAERMDLRGSPGLRFWREIAERHLTALCHVPEDAAPLRVPAPAVWQWTAWVQAAPPMAGGEYLSVDRLRRIWSQLTAWVSETAQAGGGLAAFLEERAPRWRQVGRICFHLAEHPHDEAHPFAFLATWVAGFDAAGRMKHRPLLSAVRQRIGVKDGAVSASFFAPLRRAAETCDWIRDLVQSGDVYRPLAWPPERARRLLRSVPALEEAGLSVRLPDGWRRQTRPRVEVTIGARTPARLGTRRGAGLRRGRHPRRRRVDARRAGNAARRRRRAGADQGPVGRGRPPAAAAGPPPLAGGAAAGPQRALSFTEACACSRGAPADLRGAAGDEERAVGARLRRRCDARGAPGACASRMRWPRWRSTAICGARCGRINATG